MSISLIRKRKYDDVLNSKEPKSTSKPFSRLLNKADVADGKIDCGVAEGMIDITASSLLWRQYMQQVNFIP